MMTRKRSKTLANLKLFMVVPVMAAVMLFISSCSQNNRPLENDMEVAPPPPPPPPPGVPYTVENGDTTWIAVQEMPVYQGGDAALVKYISENTSYPEIAKTSGTQGKVIVRFSVETDGKVNNVTILKGVDPELDKEAIRVVSTLPAFAKPGINDGKPVPVWYMVPITFTLK